MFFYKLVDYQYHLFYKHFMNKLTARKINPDNTVRSLNIRKNIEHLCSMCQLYF